MLLLFLAQLFTFFNYFSQCLSIIREFGDRFAEVEGLTSPVIHDQGQMVGSDGTGDCRAQAFYALDGGAGRGVLQYDSKAGKPGMEFHEVRKERGFRI